MNPSNYSFSFVSEDKIKTVIVKSSDQKQFLIIIGIAIIALIFAFNIFISAVKDVPLVYRILVSLAIVVIGGVFEYYLNVKSKYEAYLIRDNSKKHLALIGKYGEKTVFEKIIQMGHEPKIFPEKVFYYNNHEFWINVRKQLFLLNIQIDKEGKKENISVIPSFRVMHINFYKEELEKIAGFLDLKIISDE